MIFEKARQNAEEIKKGAARAIEDAMKALSSRPSDLKQGEPDSALIGTSFVSDSFH